MDIFGCIIGQSCHNRLIACKASDLCVRSDHGCNIDK